MGVASQQDLVNELEHSLKGEVRFDRISRLLYSTDASIYQIEPVGVVIPRNTDDVAAAAEIAARHGIALLPRGSGSSLAGQAVGQAVILDFSKYMHNMLEINPDEHWVRVQPGIALDNLNRVLADYGLKFGPDPSSGNRATIGGILGNNGTGSHSILYGMSVKQLLSARVALADGSLVSLRETGGDEVKRLAKQQGLTGRIYREIPELLERYADAIDRDYPLTWRRAGGYNLDYVPTGSGEAGGMNPAKLMAGSEGTLGMIVEARLNLHRVPRAVGLVVIEFDDLMAAMEAVPEILETGPSAIELNDDNLIKSCRAIPEYAKLLTFVRGDPAALLIAEYYGEDAAGVKYQSNQLIERLQRRNTGKAFTPILDSKGMANVWKVRKNAVGLVMSRPGDFKPIAFIEDVSVPVERLPSFVAGLQKMLAEHEVQATIYGHASAGCLHVRPLINQKSAESLGVMESILQATASLIVDHHGALSGEHGAGLVRSSFNRMIYGPRLYQAFRELKAVFDPGNRMNPGKIVDAPAPLESPLRYGPEYRAAGLPSTGLSFLSQNGMDGAIEMCNGQGVCRKLGVGAMCPSFQASREEMHSTRGRANVLRAAISGRLGRGLPSPSLPPSVPPIGGEGRRFSKEVEEGFSQKSGSQILPLGEDGRIFPPFGGDLGGALTNTAVKQALDLCLACKSCKSECPSAVDMAKLKAEVQHQMHLAGKVTLRDWLLGHAHLMNRVGAAAAPFSNWVMRMGITRLLQHHLLGIHKNRTMPAWARPTFSAWWRKRSKQARQTPGRNGQVVLFHETLTDYNHPQVGQAAVKVLETAGFSVIILEERKCCGRPLLSKGFIDEARKHAAHNVALLAPYARQGIPIIGCEPSCVTMFLDDYLDLLPGEETELVAKNTYLITDFLVKLAAEGRLELSFGHVKREVLVHSHCHERAVCGAGGTVQALKLSPNFRVSEIDAGCCGMAGSFGFEKEHYDFSLQVGEDRLFPAIRAAAEKTEILLTGTSCRDQVEHVLDRRVRHPIELIADAIIG